MSHDCFAFLVHSCAMISLNYLQATLIKQVYSCVDVIKAEKYMV